MDEAAKQSQTKGKRIRPGKSLERRIWDESGKILVLEKTRTNRVEPLRNWICEANAGEKLLSEENFGEMKSFLRKVGLNRVFRDQTLTVSFVKPWDSLAQTVESSFADNEFTHVSEKWWR